MDEIIKAQIVDVLKEMAITMAPDMNLREMYGGLVIELEKDNPKSRVGGIFAYTGHVSLELSKGATFEDPKNLLQGSGKLRRHIKLRSLGDLESKCCREFLETAVLRT